MYSGACDSQRARKELSLPLTGRIYMIQGLLRPYKGIDLLLAAWAEAGMAERGHHLLIAGKPIDLEFEQELEGAATQTSNVILHTGFIEEAQMHLYFSAANIVVLPFRRILNSSSLILAMSYDKPVIAPDVSTIAEVVEGAGDLLYDPAAVNGLSLALRRSLDVDLRDLSHRVRIACDALDWDRILERHSQDLRSLVS